MAIRLNPISLWGAGVMTTQKWPRQPSTEAKFDDDDYPEEQLGARGHPAPTLAFHHLNAVSR
jgi:hypothetical protein